MKETAKKKSGVGMRPAVSLRDLSEEALAVIFVVVLFVAASGWLFFHVNRELDPDNGKNWWTLAFENRDTGSLSFVIENHSASTIFTFNVSHDKDVIDAGNLTIERGGRKAISLPANAAEGRTIVTVTSSDGSKKEIYRNH
ncbi:MAG: hypothetical protein HGB37_03770 [Candidatus Moranbacteria bacterium]|nr:hypothetical protein [Candidatus Moranbacteria bacterium]